MKMIDQHRASRRLLVVMPSWVGDTVMATPTMRALRDLYPSAKITALVRNSVRPVLDACPWIDGMVVSRGDRRRRGRHKDKSQAGNGTFSLARQLKAKRFDTAVLLPNSFRSALTVMLLGIPRRVGYDRDGRGFLLTDRLLPRRDRGAFIPVPMLDYYLGLARYLGATDVDPTMQLATRPEDDATVDRLLASQGHRRDRNPLVLIVPGASYGSAKMWLAERFAQVADRCVRELSATVAVGGSPRERNILDQVTGCARERIIDLTKLGIDLTLFKSVVKCSRLVVTNDTGPRHIAAAMKVPVITIFGPTDPAWTQINFPDERQVMVEVECGPCQLKNCPLDHRCMKQIEPDMVMNKAIELMALTGVKS